MDSTVIVFGQPAAPAAQLSASKKPRTDLCEHHRQRSTCKDCGGSGIYEHWRVRSQCKDCGGSSICEHQRVEEPVQGLWRQRHLPAQARKEPV